MNIINKKLYIYGGFSIFLAGLTYWYFCSKKKVLKLLYAQLNEAEITQFKTTSDEAEANLAQLLLNSRTKFQPQTSEENIISSFNNPINYIFSIEQIIELYSIILDNFFPKLLEMTIYFRNDRRQYFNDIVEYYNAYVNHADKIAYELNKTVIDILQLLQIDEYIWVMSIEYYLKKNVPEIVYIVREWMKIFDNRRLCMRKLTKTEYANAITILCDGIEKDKNDNVWEVLSNKNVKIEVLRMLKLYHAWDYLYFRLNLEEEDVKLDSITKDKQELTDIGNRYIHLLQTL